jgi:hypothetical protein
MTREAEIDRECKALIAAGDYGVALQHLAAERARLMRREVMG